MSSTSANPKAAAASAASSSGGAAEGVSTSSTSTSAAGPRSSHPLNHAKINNNNSHRSNSDDNQSNMDIDDASGGEGDEGHSPGHASGAAAKQGSGPTALHLTSDEVNYLIFRYMQESGFTHSAYTFVYESMLGRSHIRNSEKSVPPGALVSFLQKGLQYVGIEETLQREMQQQQSVGGKTKAAADAAPSPAISESVMNNLSLLAPQTVQAMIRENPPLQLNVPPATAAAAVKARLEAEAQLDKERREEAMKEALARAAVDGVDRNQGRAVILAQPSLLTNPLANAAAFEVQAAQAAAMMQQQHAAVSRQHPDDHPYAAAAAQQQQKQAAQAAGASPPGHLNPHHHPSAPATERNSASAGAAALMAAQQRRAVAHEIAVLEQQREAQLVQQQLHIQQQLQQEQEKMRQEAAAHALHAQQQQQQKRQSEAAAVALASASDQSRGVAASVSGSNNPPSISSQDDPNALANATMGKRPLGAKRAPKNKGKTPKKTVAGFVGPTAGPNNGFATLEEAVARLEASKASNGGEAATVETPVQAPQDVAMVDASGGATPEGELQRQGLNLHRFKLAQHHPAAAAELAASGGLMNGSHPQGETYFNGSVPNGPVLEDPSQQAMMVEGRPPSGSTSLAAQKTPEELAIIDKEDELTNVNPCEVLELKMHQSEVFMCAWNGIFTEMIATGSGDASARIWQMGGPKAADGLGPVRLLPHGTGPRDRKNKDVTTLEWASDGKLLATGSYDGVARVWSLNGALVHTLRGHKGPIFSLKWNKKGNFLLSGSYDKTTIVWDVSGSNGFIEQQFNDHQAPALDVDWKDDTTFASCSTDKTVHICCVGMPRPLKSYTGHTDEVNAVKWDPSGTLLASCSDDCTAKVWDVNSDRTDPLYDFKSHQQEIYTVKWAPTGPGSKNPYKHRMLATASFDGSVRLWNAEDGSCMQVFSRHRDSVYSVAFSPSGSFLASGSLAGQLYIWNVGEGKHIKSFKGKGDIFEVAWNKEETRVAACFSSNVVCIIDFP